MKYTVFVTCRLFVMKILPRTELSKVFARLGTLLWQRCRKSWRTMRVDQMRRIPHKQNFTTQSNMAIETCSYTYISYKEFQLDTSQKHSVAQSNVQKHNRIASFNGLHYIWIGTGYRWDTRSGYCRSEIGRRHSLGQGRHDCNSKGILPIVLAAAMKEERDLRPRTCNICLGTGTGMLVGTLPPRSNDNTLIGRIHAQTALVG